MPKIPTFTAENGPGVMQTAAPSPESFGAGGFNKVTQFGLELKALDNRIQHAKDQLDVSRVAADYEMGLDVIKNRVVLEPDLSKHGDMLAEQTQQLQESILKDNPGLSPAAKTTFQSHANLQHAQARIDVAYEGRKIQVQRSIADFSATQDRLMEAAATATDPTVTMDKLALANGLRENMVRSGFLSATDAKKSEDLSRDKYWSIYAQHDPQGMLAIAQEQAEGKKAGEGGTTIAGMDAEKLHTYVGLAVSTLHAQQLGATAAEKAEDDRIKHEKALNADLLTADLIEGKPIMDRLPGLLRARAIDDTVARTLAETQVKLAGAPDIAKYQKDLAVNIEASLEQQKYNNKPLDPALAEGLTEDFLQRRIIKEEFTHLMGVLRSVDDYKHQQGKEKVNQDITHAHANLVQRLKTTGPADKFDALSEQTIAEAGQFFYRRMNQDPNADPWKVMKEAEDIFRPAIEKRLGLSKTDKAQLDDAKLQGMVHTKALSPAGYKAKKEAEQWEEGKRIVDKAIADLPPPPPPGFFERLFQKKQERTQGVRQGE